MSTLPSENPPAPIPDDLRDTVLRVLVSFGGDATRTSSVLEEEHDMHLKAATLVKWRDETFRDSYADMAAEYAHKLESSIVHETREAIVTAGRVQREALEKAAALMGTATDAKTAAAIANDVSKVKAANTRDLLTLTGRPARITEDRDARQIMEAMLKRGLLIPVKRVDSEAEVVPSPE